MTADRIAVQDLNNDERPDLALSYTTFNGSQPAGQVSVLIGDGAGGFIMPANLALPLQAGSQTRVFALGDINGDGNRDLGVIEILGATRRVLLYFGNGAGGFTSQELADGAGRVPHDRRRCERRRPAGSGRLHRQTSLHVFTRQRHRRIRRQSTPFSTPSALQFELAGSQRRRTSRHRRRP